MNNKEKRLREMCEREREFCDLLIDLLIDLLLFSFWLKWSRCGNEYLFSSHGIEWRFLSLAKVFRLLYLGPTRPTKPIKSDI